MFSTSQINHHHHSEPLRIQSEAAVIKTALACSQQTTPLRLESIKKMWLPLSPLSASPLQRSVAWVIQYPNCVRKNRQGAGEHHLSLWKDDCSYSGLGWSIWQNVELKWISALNYMVDHFFSPSIWDRWKMYQTTLLKWILFSLSPGPHS